VGSDRADHATAGTATMVRRDGPVPWDPEPPAWWRNGLGWILFVVAPGCGMVIGLAIGRLA